MEKLKAIIFDVDGTLAETEEAHRGAFNETFKDWGLDWFWTQDIYHKLLAVGGSKERIKHYARTVQPEGHEIVLQNDLNVVKMHQQKTARYSAFVSSGQVSLRPGVARLIEEAQMEGLKLGIATTTNLEPLEALFKGTLGLECLKYFEAIAAGDMVKHKKPAPDLYLLALQQLGLSADECIAVEDSSNGLRSAIAAGLPTIITENAYSQGHDFSEALTVVSDLAEPHQFYTPLGGVAKTPDYVTVKGLQAWHKHWLKLR